MWPVCGPSSSTSGEHPSDNAIHGGGFGSLMSAIGPSPSDIAAQNLLGYTSALSGLTRSGNPVSQSFENSLLGAGDLSNGGLGNIGGFRNAVGGTPGAYPLGSAYPVSLGVFGSSPSVLQPSWSSVPASGPGGYSHDPYLGIGSGLGLGSLPQYQTATSIIGPPYGGADSAHGGGIGFDDSTATTISSRINGKKGSSRRRNMTGTDTGHMRENDHEEGCTELTNIACPRFLCLLCLTHRHSSVRRRWSSGRSLWQRARTRRHPECFGVGRSPRYVHELRTRAHT